MHALTSSPKGGETGLLVLPWPQFRDTVAWSHGQSGFREVLELCPTVEPVVSGLFLGQAPESQLHRANDYRNPTKVNPTMLGSLHSVYLLAGITLETWSEEREDLREFPNKKVLPKKRQFKDDNLKTAKPDAGNRVHWQAQMRGQTRSRVPPGTSLRSKRRQSQRLSYNTGPWSS